MADAESGEEAQLRARLEAIVRATPSLMRVLETARALDLPDWMIFSGAIYQPVLNHLTGRSHDYGLKDYDLGYFDPSDTSYEAEDVVIRRVAAAFDEPLGSLVEVRNQARVHIWFEGKYGEVYTPLSATAEALRRFTATAYAVGVRLDPGDRLHVEAPFGLADLFALRLRRNPSRRTVNFEHSASSALARWPELRIVGEA